VSNSLVRVTIPEVPVTGSFVRCNQINLVTDRFTNKAIQRSAIRILDHPTDNVPLARNRGDYWDFARRAAPRMRPSTGVFILFLAADKSLINLDLPHQLWEIVTVVQRRAYAMAAMADIESGLIGGRPAIFLKLALNLKSAHAFLRLTHEVDNLEPDWERVIRILEHSGDQWRKPITVSLVTNGFFAVWASAILAALADPIPSAGFQPEHLVIAAARTLHSRRPPQAGKQFHALVLGLELFVKLPEAQHKTDFATSSGGCQVRNNSQKKPSASGA
jgi:hypothetical protein